MTWFQSAKHLGDASVFVTLKPSHTMSADNDLRISINPLMHGLHLQLNRRKSRAPPPTQPSLIFKDLRRLRCWWRPTLKIYDGWVAGGARFKIWVRLKINDGRGSLTTVVEVLRRSRR